MGQESISKMNLATVLEKVELAARRTHDELTKGPGLHSEGVAFGRFAEEVFRIIRELRNAPSPR